MHGLSGAALVYLHRLGRDLHASGDGEVTHPELDTLTPFCCSVPFAELFCEQFRSARTVLRRGDHRAKRDSLDAFVDGFDEQASDVREPTEDGERQDEPDPRFALVCTRVLGHHRVREKVVKSNLK